MSKIVDRTMEVFEMFAAQKRPLSLSDMTRILDIPISSCHDVVRALQSGGYLYETAARAGYYPTTRLYKLCKIIVDHDPLVQRAEPVLERVRDELDESVTLAKANDMSATYLLVFEPAHPIRFSVTVGSQIRSLHATSAGKAFLGSLPEDTFEEFLKTTQLAPMTSRTITSKAKLRSDIEQSRKRGWFLNREESVTGAVTLSSFFRWNNAVYILTVAGPTDRMEAKLDETAKAIMQACVDLSST